LSIYYYETDAVSLHRGTAEGRANSEWSYLFWFKSLLHQNVLFQSRRGWSL